jgi:hypothetical protein
MFGQHHPFVRLSYSVLPTLPGGLHLYGNYPFLQIGPPPLLVAKAIQVGPREGIYVAGVLVQLLGLGYIYFLDRAFGAWRTRIGRAAVLVGGAVVTAAWGSVTHYRHLDALTLCSIAAAAWAMTRARPVTAGLLLGLAAASKPWGVPALALALTFPTWRTRTVSLAAAAATVLTFWGPFIVADRETLKLGEVTLQLSPASALSALGVHHLASGQPIRLLQFGAGLVLASVVVLRGAWPLAPLVAFTARLLIEPSAYPYYIAAVVAAAFLADLGAVRGRLPLLTIIAALGWIMALAAHGTVAAWTRLVLYVSLLAAALMLSWILPRGTRLDTASTTS